MAIRAIVTALFDQYCGGFAVAARLPVTLPRGYNIVVVKRNVPAHDPKNVFAEEANEQAQLLLTRGLLLFRRLQQWLIN